MADIEVKYRIEHDPNKELYLVYADDDRDPLDEFAILEQAERLIARLQEPDPPPTPQEELEDRFVQWYHQTRKELHLGQIETMETIRKTVALFLEGLYELRGHN